MASYYIVSRSYGKDQRCTHYDFTSHNVPLLGPDQIDEWKRYVKEVILKKSGHEMESVLLTTITKLEG